MKYPLAIRAAGGLPWLLPVIPDARMVAEAVRRVDGVMLTGGDDVEPRLYGRRPERRVARTVGCPAPERDLTDLMVIAEVFRQRKPLLAICRGHQLLNVALGGTLLADILLQKPGAQNHCRTDHKDKVVHSVSCAEGSMIARLARRKSLGVNSAHHQAVGRIAKPLRVTAVSYDGIVECMELAASATGLLPWLLAVQFHPERLFARHDEHLAMFQQFIGACGRNRVGKT